MEVVKLIAQRRTQTGKGVARQLRRGGQLPAVLYGRGESVAVAVDEREFVAIQRSGAGGNAILDFELRGEDAETCNAIVRDIQLDALTGAVLHIDFYRLDMSQPITVAVPLEFVDVPEDRLKAANASWLPLIRELDVQCLPRDIPDHITVSLETMDVGVTLHASDVELPGGVSLVGDGEEPLVTVTMVTAEVEEEIEAEAEEVTSAEEAEATAASEAEDEEPPSDA